VSMEAALALMNPWWEGKSFEIGKTRVKYLSQLHPLLETKQITFITGLRRVGKTTLMKQCIHQLLSCIPPNNIFYTTLDFISFQGKTIHDIIETFRTIHKHPINTKLYLFLDEITHIKSFEQELKNLYDLENVRIVASSSSASLMKSKKNFLVGRARIIEVLPLDFEEYLAFKEITINKSEQYLTKKYFEDYLRVGGMPEYVLHENIEYIKTIIEQIIYKDIIAMHNIKDHRTVEKLFLLLCERVGKRVTYAKLARLLGVSVDTVRRYIAYFKDTFLFYTIEKHARSLNERTYAPEKVYIADTGIRNAFLGFRDKGALFENLVFMQIRDSEPRYYYENGKEIDFVIGKTAIEAKYKENIDDEELQFFYESRFKKKILVTKYQDLKDLQCG
jgi:uncharacterized protein